MRRGLGTSWLVIATALVWGTVGCGDAGDSPEQSVAPTPVQLQWQTAAELAVDQKFGTTAGTSFAVPGEQRFVVVRVVPVFEGVAPAKRTVCYQLDNVTTGAGSKWVDNSRKRRDWGTVCKHCAQRVTSAKGAGVFVFPNDGKPLGNPATLQLRPVLRDCATGVAADSKLNPDLPPKVTVQWATEASVPGEIERLDVSVVGLKGAPWTAAAPAAQALFRQAGIYATIQLQDEPAPRHERVVVVRGAACDDIASSGSGDLLGWSPRVPGGMAPDGVQDGIWIASDFCGQPELSIDDAARLLLHEIGHYLGLHHSDQPEANHRAPGKKKDVMHSKALASTEKLDFTAAQLEVLRRHPFVWQQRL